MARTIDDIYNQLDGIAGILRGIDGRLAKLPVRKGIGGVGDSDDEKKDYRGWGKNEELTEKEFKKRAATIRAVGEAVETFGKAVVDVTYAIKSANLDIKIAQISAASDKFVNNLALSSQTLSKSIKGLLITDPKAVVAQTLSSLQDAVALSAESYKTSNRNAIIEQNRQIAIQKATNEKNAAIVGAGAAAIGIALAATGGAALPAVAAIAALTAVVNIGTHWYKQSLSYKVKEMEAEKLKLEKSQKMREGYIDMIKGVTDEFMDKGKDIVNESLKINDEARKFGRMFGVIGASMGSYEKNILKVNKAMAELGKSSEEYFNLQRGYISSTGRNAILSDTDAKSLSALGMLWGLSENENSGIAGGMQIFNKSAKESSESVFEMGNEFQIMGLSQQKFAKDLVNNLKLAQKYDFKNGTKGLMEMALFAQRTRMDMAQLDSILSGFHTGNIEDVITKAAQLNVLGGNAALISDPIGMLYDAYANPKGMAGRVLQSISGMGFFNTRTGETEFGIAERMRIEQIAKAMGMSPENLTEMARQENKGRELNRIYGESAFGKYNEMVKQNAFYENGRWRINTINGTMDLDAMRGNDKLLSEIMPNSAEEQLVVLAQKQFSVQEEIAANTRQGVASAVEGSYATTIEHYNQIADTITQIWEKFGPDYVSIVNTITGKAAEQQRILLETNMENVKKLINVQLTDAITKQEELLSGANKELSRFMTLLEQNNNNLDSTYQKIEANNRDEDIKSIVERNFPGAELQSKHNNVYRYHKANGEPFDIVAPKEKDYIVGESELTVHPYYRRADGIWSQMSTSTYYKIKDAAVTPRGDLIEPNANDLTLYMQPGGGIKKVVNGDESESSNIPRSINVSGSLFLNTNGQSVDLVELINRNPEEFYRVTSSILFPTNGQSRVNV